MAGMSDSPSMNDQVENLIKAFGRLTEGEQREFAVAVLQRLRELNWLPLDHEAGNQIADESFVEYDIREAVDAQD